MKELLIVVCLSLFVPFHSQENARKNFEEDVQLFTELYDLIQENYVDTIINDEFIYNILKQTASSVDSYTRFFTKEETVLRNKSWSGISYAGIGANVNFINEEVIIEYCKKGYGADSVGLMMGDEIVSINDSSVVNLNLTNTVKLLKGPSGTSVKVNVKRGEVIKDFTIIRKQIVSPSIGYTNLYENEIALIKINQFLRGSGVAFRDEVRGFIDRGAKGIVVDLRGNRGGIVKECISMLSAFLPKGTLICQLKSKDPKSNYKEYTKQDPINTSIPIVILIDKNTMSSAEIFAGVMQDLDRAVLIGENTFGKGLVQGTRFLEDESTLYITAARYHLPSGRSINISAKNKPFISSPAKETTPQFFTLNGRVVQANTGVLPDLFISQKSNNSNIINSVSKSRLDFNFTVSQLRKIKLSPEDSTVANKKEYLKYLLKNKETINLNAEKEWRKAKQSTTLSTLPATVLIRVEKGLNKIKKQLIKSSIDDLYKELNKGIIYQTKYLEGLYAYNLKTDDCFNKSIELISNQSKYKKVINYH